MFLDTSVEAFSKFTRRRTDGPGVQKRSESKNKVVFADFAGKF